jgi:hypothetical protein
VTHLTALVLSLLFLLSANFTFYIPTLQYQANALPNGVGFENNALVYVDGHLKQAELDQPVMGLPVTYSEDLNTVYYATQRDSIYYFANQQYLNVIAQDMSTGDREIVGAISYADGCGGSYDTPMRYLYDQESGYEGNAPVFTLTDYGLLHTMSCTGEGLALLPLDQETPFILSEPRFSRVSLSADGSMIAGRYQIDPETALLMVIDLSTKTSKIVAQGQFIDQIGWQSNEELCYTLREPAGDLVDAMDFSEEEKTKLESALYPSGDVPKGLPLVQRYAVSLYRVNVDAETPQSTLVTEFDNLYGIARLFAVDDVMMSVMIPDGTAWLQALLAGDLAASDSVLGGTDYVTPETVQISLDS